MLCLVWKFNWKDCRGVCPRSSRGIVTVARGGGVACPGAGRPPNSQIGPGVAPDRSTMISVVPDRRNGLVTKKHKILTIKKIQVYIVITPVCAKSSGMSPQTPVYSL